MSVVLASVPVMKLALPEGGLSLGLQRVPEPRAGKNRVHIDLGAEDREQEVKRLVALGATEQAQHEVPGFAWTVLSDPEGNEFCVSGSHDGWFPAAGPLRVAAATRVELAA